MRYLRDIPSPPPVNYPSIAFLSLAPIGSGYVGVYREFKPELSNTRSRIRVQHYSAGFDLVGDSRPLTTEGEDPRTFCWRGSAWTLVEIWKGKSDADCHFVLINPLTFDTIYLRHDLRYAGKNWMPVTGVAEQLYIVRSLEPLSLLRMDDDGRCHQVIHRDGPIGSHRGGAAARFENGRIVGYGHETLTRDHHVPFRFALDIERQTVEYTYPLRGHDPLADPTSFWGDSVVCCCARRNWWEPQPLVHRLYQV